MSVPSIPGVQWDTALLDAIGGIRRSPQQYGQAPHKPLLLLFALARAQMGLPRLASFSDYEQPLNDLLARHGEGNTQDAASPFWHLQNDGLWEVVRGDDESAVVESGSPFGDPPMAILREQSVRGGLPKDVFELVSSHRYLFAAACQLVLESFEQENQVPDLIKHLHLELPDDDACDYREYALRRIERATGQSPAIEEGGSQTYMLPSGARFHLRTMRRFARPNHWYSYWFAIRNSLWKPGEVFVFQCGLAGTLIVPADDWLAIKDHIPLAKEGTRNGNRQPQIWREDRNFELRVADEPGKVTEEGKLDARTWLDRFEHVMTPASTASGAPKY